MSVVRIDSPDIEVMASEPRTPPVLTLQIDGDKLATLRAGDMSVDVWHPVEGEPCGLIVLAAEGDGPAVHMGLGTAELRSLASIALKIAGELDGGKGVQ